MSELSTQFYINKERARCVALVEMLIKEPDFLIYCLRAPIYPEENIPFHRKRFGEFAPAKPADEFEDLM